MKSVDWRERLQAVRELGRERIATPEVFQSLLDAVRDKVFDVAYEAARVLALLGDDSVVPRLMEERQTVIRELKTMDGFVDTSERSIENALTIAIISLLPAQDCEQLAETGNEFERYMVRRKNAVHSKEELWGPIRN